MSGLLSSTPPKCIYSYLYTSRGLENFVRSIIPAKSHRKREIVCNYICSTVLWNGRYSRGTSRKRIVNCMLLWLCKCLWIPLYKWGGTKKFEKLQTSLPFLPRFVGYYLKGYDKNLNVVSGFKSFQWLLLRGDQRNNLWFSKSIALLMRFRWLPIRGMFAVGMGKQSVNFIG